MNWHLHHQVCWYSNYNFKEDDFVDEKNIEGGPNIEYELVFGKSISNDPNFDGLQIDPIKAVNLDDDTAKLLIKVLSNRKDNDTVDNSTGQIPLRDPYSTIVKEGAPEETIAILCKLNLRTM